MNLIDEVAEYAKANAEAARSADERLTWEAHNRNCKNVAAEIERLTAEIERLREGHQEIMRKYERVMGDPPEWTRLTAEQLKWVREAWYGASQISHRAIAGNPEQGATQTERET